MGYSTEEWAGIFAQGIDEHGSEQDLEGVAAVDDPGEAALLMGPVMEADLSEFERKLLDGTRTVAGLASRIKYSPTPHGESSPAWVFALVLKAHPLLGPRPAFFAVRRDIDTRWSQLDGQEIPWFLASTASSLRAALDDGRPLTVKDAAKGDPRLLERARGSNPPAADERGDI